MSVKHSSEMEQPIRNHTRTKPWFEAFSSSLFCSITLIVRFLGWFVYQASHALHQSQIKNWKWFRTWQIRSNQGATNRFRASQLSILIGQFQWRQELGIFCCTQQLDLTWSLGFPPHPLPCRNTRWNYFEILIIRSKLPSLVVWLLLDSMLTLIVAEFHWLLVDSLSGVYAPTTWTWQQLFWR